MKWSWGSASKTTDGHRVSPLGDDATRKGDKGDQPSGGEILERHDLAEDSTRQANLETACWGLRPNTGHCRCPMMTILTSPLRDMEKICHKGAPRRWLKKSLMPSQVRRSERGSVILIHPHLRLPCLYLVLDSVFCMFNGRFLHTQSTSLMGNLGSFYIAQYPVLWTAQSALHRLPSLADLFIPTPTRLLREAF